VALHGVISPEIIFFITTAVRTSNPTYFNAVLQFTLTSLAYRFSSKIPDIFLISPKCAARHVGLNFLMFGEKYKL
jgi:hypothetical protein